MKRVTLNCSTSLAGRKCKGNIRKAAEQEEELRNKEKIVREPYISRREDEYRWMT